MPTNPDLLELDHCWEGKNSVCNAETRKFLTLMCHGMFEGNFLHELKCEIHAGRPAETLWLFYRLQQKL
jgi:hypothetical protein